MNYVVCLKHGTKYSAEYVNVLYNMVQRNLTIPHEFVCFTEDPKDINPNIRIEPLPIANVKGWWYKPFMFDPELLPEGTRLFLDLDVIIFNNIDNLFTYESGKFCIIRDFNRFQNKQWNKMNSSVFRLNHQQQEHVYKNFIENPTHHSRRFHGDQDWIFNQVKKDWIFWPDEWIQSYKWEMRGKPQMIRGKDGKRNFAQPGTPNILKDTNIAVFHGDPNPHYCIDPWCKENWR